MTLSTDDCLAAIEDHSAGLAAAAHDNLAAPVRHCPGWTVADLVHHVSDVHWFWATIAEERPQELPDYGDRRPARVPDERLLDRFEQGARRLVEVLRAADQSAPCWTWAPGHQDVAFITRHQVQEAAVHHWDAVRAAGGDLLIKDHVAQDAVEEFLTVSVSSEADPADPPRPALAGALWFCACAGESAQAPTWLVTDGPVPGTVAWRRLGHDEQPGDLVDDGVAMVGGHGAAEGLLLWLYGRCPQPFEGGATGDTAVLDRFRALCFTD